METLILMIVFFVLIHWLASKVELPNDPSEGSKP